MPITTLSRDQWNTRTHEQVETRRAAAEIRPGHVKPQSCNEIEPRDSAGLIEDDVDKMPRSRPVHMVRLVRTKRH